MNLTKEEFFRLLDIAWVCWGGSHGEWRRDFTQECKASYMADVIPANALLWSDEWAKERCAAYPEKRYDDLDKGGFCRHCGVHESEHK